jgi:HEAT repeat protein
LERGRLGDRGAAAGLAGLLADGEAPTRREAARLLCHLPPDAATRPQLLQAAAGRDTEVARWARLGLARLGDTGERAALAANIAASCAGGDPAYCAQAALAVGDAAWLGRALEQAAEDDRPTRVALIQALGKSGAPGALDPLLVEMGSVRNRGEVVDALTQLGDPRAVGPVARWVGADPYVPVRAKMARLLGILGKGEPAAARALCDLAATEVEPPVMRQAVLALAAIGRSEALPFSGAIAVVEPRQLWLVGEGAIAVEFEGKPAPVVAEPGVAAVAVSRPGRVTARGARWAYSRALTEALIHER